MDSLHEVILMEMLFLGHLNKIFNHIFQEGITQDSPRNFLL